MIKNFNKVKVYYKEKLWSENTVFNAEGQMYMRKDDEVNENG